MNDEYIRSSRPFFPKQDIQNIMQDISKALEEGKLRNGENLKSFERNIAEYLNIKNAIALDSDSSAFEIALNYFGVKNREVIVCTNSFISVPNSVLYSGGKVVFADIRKETLSMDPSSLREKLSKDTCGVIVTHIAGFPNPDLEEIEAICKERNLFLIEDAAHAIGATVNGQKAGTFGDAAVFAFTPTKVVTTGEGGMLSTNNDELTEYARRYSYYGSGPGKTNFVNLGRHMMMPEISAILGVYQLKRVEEFITRRNEIAKTYNEAFDKISSVSTVKCSSNSRSSYYKYPLTLSDEVNKAKFTELLKDRKVETGSVFYPPCHMQTVYQNIVGSAKYVLPISERILAQTITLPMHADLSDANVAQVTQNVQEVLQKS
jgi:perosamine synthetase